MVGNGWSFLSSMVAATSRVSRLGLVEHLLAQNAPRAAACIYSEELRHELRVAAPERARQLDALLAVRDPSADERGASDALARGSGALFVAPRERVNIVADPVAVSAFARVVRTRVADAEAEADHEGGARGELDAPARGWTVALDAEWRPDLSAGSNNPPSLLQLASDEMIWLIDLQALVEPRAPSGPTAAEVELVGALGVLLGSPAVRILGFSIQSDLDKLNGAFGHRAPCFASARAAIDLRDACEGARLACQAGSGGGDGRSGGGGGGGAQRIAARASNSLAAQLEAWCGVRLDKREQTSDWACRPLTDSQLAYAANDAACLLLLHAALLARAPALALQPRAYVAAPPRAAAADRQASMAARAPAGTSETAAPAGVAEAACTADGDTAGACKRAVAARNLEAVRRAAAAATASGIGVRCWVAPADVVARAVALADEAAGGPSGSAWAELNALCFVCYRPPPANPLPPSRTPGKGKVAREAARELVLVITPAAERVDVRWLSCALGLPSRAVRLASADECVELFGAPPGTVPPLPLRADVRVVSYAALRNDGVARACVGSSDDGVGSSDDGAGSSDDGAGSSDDGAGSSDDGAGSSDDGAGSSDDGAGSSDDGVGSSDGFGDEGNEGGTCESGEEGSAGASFRTNSSGSEHRRLINTNGARSASMACAEPAALPRAASAAADAPAGAALEAAAAWPTVDDAVLWGSSGHPDFLLVISRARASLPALTRHAPDTAGAPASVPPASAASSTPARFEWLPDTRLGALSLDEIILGCRDFYAATFPPAPASSELARLRAGASAASAGPQFGAGAGQATPIGLARGADAARAHAGAIPAAARRPLVVTLDCAMSKLARMLRLVGVDAAVAGETVRAELAGFRGLARVKVDASLAEADFRRAAAQGRVLLCRSRRAADALPGTAYSLLASDADGQFAELLDVFGLRDAVDGGASRCGICNSDRWRRLCASEARGRVPAGVLSETRDFFQCGSCEQIFWPGPKYSSTMDSLRAAVAAGEASAP